MAVRYAALAWAVTAALVLAACARPRAVVELPASAVRPGYEETGWASWYGHPYHGRRTASGEVYDMTEMTAAHRTLPFGTRLMVENLDSGRAAEVRINDRGPFTDPRRILDLSYAAARVLGATGPGVIPVRLRVLSDAAVAAPVARRAEFTVQVGAFSTAQRAQALAQGLGSAGADATVQPAEVAGRTLYRVRVGPFPSRAAAAAEAERLAALGHAVLVLEE